MSDLALAGILRSGRAIVSRLERGFRMNYNHAQIRWSHRYADIAIDNGDGVTHMDYTKFQDVIPL